MEERRHLRMEHESGVDDQEAYPTEPKAIEIATEIAMISCCVM